MLEAGYGGPSSVHKPSQVCSGGLDGSQLSEPLAVIAVYFSSPVESLLQNSHNFGIHAWFLHPSVEQFPVLDGLSQVDQLPYVRQSLMADNGGFKLGPEGGPLHYVTMEGRDVILQVSSYSESLLDDRVGGVAMVALILLVAKSAVSLVSTGMRSVTSFLR